MIELLSALFSIRPKAPISTASAISAAFLPSFLLLFLAHPGLFRTLEFAKLVLLSASIGFPVLLLWYLILSLPMVVYSARDLVTIVTVPDDASKRSGVHDVSERLEWPLLWSAGLLTNMTLFPVAALAYTRPVAVGGTMLLLVSLLSILLVVVWTVGTTVVMWIRMGELIESGDVELDERFKDSWWARRLMRRHAPDQQGVRSGAAASAPPAASVGFIAGQAVEHNVHGNGIVTMVSQRRGADHMLTVKFDSGRRIAFTAPYTGLRRR